MWSPARRIQTPVHFAMTCAGPLETNTRQDVFVVAGTDVWRMGASQTTESSLETMEGLLEGNFDGPLYHVQTTDEPQVIPFVPLEITFDDESRNVDGGNGRILWTRDDSRLEVPLLYSTASGGDVTCYTRASWDFELPEYHDVFEPHDATNTPDERRPPRRLCQLLAARGPSASKRAVKNSSLSGRVQPPSSAAAPPPRALVVHDRVLRGETAGTPRGTRAGRGRRRGSAGPRREFGDGDRVPRGRASINF